MWKSVIIKGRCGVEIMIESFFRDRSVSWVRIVNGIDKYVTEASQEILVTSVENRGTGKPVAEAEPRPKPTLTLSLASISWTKMDRRWARKIQSRLFWTSWWYSSSITWWSCKICWPSGLVLVKVCGYFALVNWTLDHLPGKKEEDRRKGSEHIQGHWGGTLVDPILQDNVLLPNDFADYIWRIGNAHDMHSIIQGGSIPGGRSLKRDRQSVSLTAVNPMCANQRSPVRSG